MLGSIFSFLFYMLKFKFDCFAFGIKCDYWFFILPIKVQEIREIRRAPSGVREATH
jgi:hypothetical protein